VTAIGHFCCVCLALSRVQEPGSGSDWLDLNRLGTELQQQGRYSEAEQAFNAALEAARLASQADAGTPSILNNLAFLYQDTGRTWVAETRYRRVVSLLENAHGNRHPVLAVPLANLASLYVEQGQPGPARRLYERIAGLQPGDSPSRVDSFTVLRLSAAILEAEGRSREAEAAYLQLLPAAQAAFGENSVQMAEALAKLGLVCARMNRQASAASYLVRGLSMLEGLVGEDHPSLVNPMSNLGTLYMGMRRHADAECLLARALRIAAASFGEENLIYGQVLRAYAETLGRLNRKQESKAARERSEAILATVSRFSRHTVDVKDLRNNP